MLPILSPRFFWTSCFSERRPVMRFGIGSSGCSLFLKPRGGGHSLSIALPSPGDPPSVCRQLGPSRALCLRAILGQLHATWPVPPPGTVSEALKCPTSVPNAELDSAETIRKDKAWRAPPGRHRHRHLQANPQLLPSPTPSAARQPPKWQWGTR